ncbi:hypothetical protein [Corynebacterium mayonis]|uniref:hypothetical protein n=1 Tax=Corynebacterium mayonis TaxID=3062461 RepID=UPI003140565C
MNDFPQPRMRPFLDAADGDVDRALDLYQWNAEMAGAVLEQISHLEVLLRQAIDTHMSSYINETQSGIPWVLLPPCSTTQGAAIEKVRERLRARNQETRDQIVANLSFGFWSGWLGSKYEELWRQCLHKAFPHSPGRRADVAGIVEQIRKFRNRVAHHDSLLNVAIKFEMDAVFRLAEYISPDAAKWMRSVDRTQAVATRRPCTTMDTVIVPAQKAWPLYQSIPAYVCQAGRYFQDVQYVAFYADRAIQPEVLEWSGF